MQAPGIAFAFEDAGNVMVALAFPSEARVATHRGVRGRRRISKKRPVALGDSEHLAHHNALLASLTVAVRAQLEPHLQCVHLDKNEVLFRAHEPVRIVHFPITAVISFVSRLESGQMLEVGIVGRDGVAGSALFPGVTAMSCDGIVQIPGTAYRISADLLRRQLLVSESLSSAVARFAQVLLVRSMQMSVCNMFHSVEQRCIRWLLAVNDLTHQNLVPLTHDLIATMLGVHRPTVTLVLGALRKAGLVTERRGQIVIRDRRRLEAACCECYQVMRSEQLRLLSASSAS